MLSSGVAEIPLHFCQLVNIIGCRYVWFLGQAMLTRPILYIVSGRDSTMKFLADNTGVTIVMALLRMSCECYECTIAATSCGANSVGCHIV